MRNIIIDTRTEEAGHAGLDSTRDTEDEVSTVIRHDDDEDTKDGGKATGLVDAVTVLLV